NTTEFRNITSCPTNFSQNVDAGTCGAVVTFTLPTTDISGGSMVLSSSLGNGDIFPVGITTVTYEERDAGNIATGNICSFDVTIVDNEAPTAICQNTTIYLDAAGNATLTAADIDNGSSDNCSAVTLTTSQTTFNCSDLGTLNVTLYVEDAYGNTSSCTATVTVEDNIAPTIACPTDIILSNDAGQCDAVVTWTAPTGADNCTGAVVTSSHNPGDTFPIGTTTVTYTITDAAGLTDSCSFNVTVNDTENPTI